MFFTKIRARLWGVELYNINITFVTCAIRSSHAKIFILKRLRGLLAAIACP